MAKRIADMRLEIATLEDAENVLKEIALARASIEACRARAEKRISEVKNKLEEETGENSRMLEVYEKILCAFIESNRHLFEKPRKHKCDWGTFGLQKVSEVVIDDPAALVGFAKRHHFDHLLMTIEKPVKAAIEEMLKDKGSVPGCHLKEGDTAVYTVAKALIDEAKESA